MEQMNFPEDPYLNDSFAFLYELADCIETGEMPTSVADGAKELVELQQKRLQEHNLTLETKLKLHSPLQLRYETKTIVADGIGGKEVNQAKLDCEYKRKRIYRKNGKKISRKKDYVHYMHFLTGNSEPYKVSAYYLLKTVEVFHNYCSGLIPWIIKIGLGLIAFLAVFSLIFQLDAFSFFFFSMLVFIGGCLLVIVCLIISFFQVMVDMSRTSALLVRVGKDAGWMTDKLEMYDEDLEWEYMEEVLLGLMQRELYSDKFPDILETKYLAHYRVVTGEKTDEGISVTVEMYVENTVYSENKIKEKREIIRMQVFHEGTMVDKNIGIQDRINSWKVINIERI